MVLEDEPTKTATTESRIGHLKLRMEKLTEALTRSPSDLLIINPVHPAYVGAKSRERNQGRPSMVGKMGVRQSRSFRLNCLYYHEPIQKWWEDESHKRVFT